MPQSDSFDFANNNNNNNNNNQYYDFDYNDYDNDYYDNDDQNDDDQYDDQFDEEYQWESEWNKRSLSHSDNVVQKNFFKEMVENGASFTTISTVAYNANDDHFAIFNVTAMTKKDEAELDTLIEARLCPDYESRRC